MAADPSATNSNRVAFLNPPLKNAMRLSGTPSASLKITLDKPTANLGVLLVDYGTDTRINYRENLGLVVTGTNDDFNLDVSGNGTGEDVEPGTGAKVTLDLAGTSISLPLVTR